ncbi:MAG: ribokinase [Firmicutes bacterium]|jgi:ribokinase|nr:ribokinase [Bacillota bacterium]
MVNQRSRITVVGSFMTDLMSRTPRLPVAGETVMGGRFKMGPGGKGSNQAMAAARLGAQVCMAASLGTDAFGDLACQSPVNAGICTDWVKRVNTAHTRAALIIVDEVKAENMIVVAPGSNSELGPDDVDEAKQDILGSDYVLLQLEIPLETVQHGVDIAHANGVKVILNPAPGRALPDELPEKVGALTPNETQATAITGMPVNDVGSAEQAARALLGRGCRTVVMTLGSDGALAVTPESTDHVPAFKVNAIDTTGAGDAFSGARAVALAEGLPLVNSVRFANAAAALSVTKVGTSVAMPMGQEVEAFMTS